MGILKMIMGINESKIKASLFEGRLYRNKYRL
jgi:hypothetical protein